MLPPKSVNSGLACAPVGFVMGREPAFEPAVVAGQIALSPRVIYRSAWHDFPAGGRELFP